VASGLGAVGGTETVVRVPALLGACPLARDRGVVSVERYEEVVVLEVLIEALVACLLSLVAWELLRASRRAPNLGR
jgi:hypothetical protein